MQQQQQQTAVAGRSCLGSSNSAGVQLQQLKVLARALLGTVHRKDGHGISPVEAAQQRYSIVFSSSGMLQSPPTGFNGIWRRTTTNPRGKGTYCALHPVSVVWQEACCAQAVLCGLLLHLLPEMTLTGSTLM